MKKEGFLINLSSPKIPTKEKAYGAVYHFIPCLNESNPWIDALEKWVKDWCVNKLPTQHIA